MYFYFLDSDAISHASHATSAREVYLANFSSVYHEMFHNAMPVLDLEYHWYYEGLTTFLTLNMQTAYMKKGKEETVQALTKGDFYKKMSERDKKFFDYVAEWYQFYELLSESPTELNGFTLYQAVGRVTLLHPELELPAYMSVAYISVQERREGISLDKKEQRYRGGNGLTYPEAMVYIEYLAKQYGLDTVVSVALGEKSFVEVFGGDFKKISADVMAYLRDEEERKAQAEAEKINLEFGENVC